MDVIDPLQGNIPQPLVPNKPQPNKRDRKITDESDIKDEEEYFHRFLLSADKKVNLY